MSQRFARVVSTISAIVVALTLAAAASASPPPPSPVDYTLLSGIPSALFHYPGADGLLPSGDDVVSGDITTQIGSDPNFHGALSWMVGQSASPDAALPTSAEAITFLEGTVGIDPAVAASGGSDPLVTGAEVIGTEFRQGLGLDSMKITAVNGGSFSTATHALTLDVDIEFTIAGITQDVSGVAVSGAAYVVDSAGFGSSGNTYVDSVLSPIATAAGAQSLVFLRVSGTLAPALPLVLIPTPFEMLLAGLAGVPAANQADLEIEKTASTNGFFVSGDTVVFTFTVTNHGPATASGVVVRDRLSDQLDYQSDDCGAGAPSGGLLTWNVGALSDGQTAVCNVTVVLNDDANFDHENGASVASETIDPDLSNNTGRVLLPERDTDGEGLIQAPNGVTGFPSDSNCGTCAVGSQAVADNFKVDGDATIGEIVFYGGYTDDQPFADDFTIEIYDNDAAGAVPGTPGVPGNPVATLSGPVLRSATGGLALGRTEYQYRVGAGVSLPRGIYWVLIYNRSPGAGDWFWESGDPDARNRSVTGLVSNVEIPLTPFWTSGTQFETALEVRAVTAAGLPVASWIGLIALALVLLALGIRGGRRGRLPDDLAPRR